MASNSTRNALWPRLADRFAASAMARSFLSELQEQSAQNQAAEVVAPLGPESTEALEDKIAAEIEARTSMQRLQHAQQKLEHAKKALTMQVYENEGIALEKEHVVDPQSCTIRKKASRAIGAPSNSRSQPVAQICGLIEEALDNILTAWQMIEDPRLPPWLRQLARALSRTEDMGDNLLAPHTRDLITQWLEHPVQARDWAETNAADSPKFLTTAAQIIALKKRWPL